MPLDLDFRKNARDLAFFADYESRSFDTHICDAVELFLFPDLIGISHGVAFIHEQVVRKRVFRPKFLMRFCAVRAYAKYRCIELPEPGKGVAEVACLTRSARGVVFRIEEENDFAPAK